MKQQYRAQPWHKHDFQYNPKLNVTEVILFKILFTQQKTVDHPKQKTNAQLNQCVLFTRPVNLIYKAQHMSQMPGEKY